jgi:hypothetical protein
VAFYFDEEVAYSNSLTQVDLAVASSIANAIPQQRRHVTILSGTLPQYEFARNQASLAHVVDSLLGRTIPAWTTIQTTELKEILSNIDVAAFVIDGLVPADSREIHRLLTRTVGYLGAIEALPSEEACWALYDNSLPARYRIVGNEMRVFYKKAEYEAGADRNEMSMTAFREANIYPQVIWEDTGVRDTIFDPYKTPEYAQAAAEVEGLINAQMAGVVNEIFLRAAQIDPRLLTNLHGAFKSFERLDTNEALAHAALSCRRLIENLANALYPPREGKVKNRLVGKAEYRNRLWAYIDDQLDSNSQRQLVLSTLQDVGNRLDKLDAVANSGLHANIEPNETRRLLVGLTSLTYDLLTLAEPPLTAPNEPYNEHTQRIVREILRRSSE